ncbi:MAG: ribosome maturation factor RimM [Gammaproteobacteria bacterium]|nr:ribosome maturation factor RimM [Gammaproteobacteria bacterium]
MRKIIIGRIGDSYGIKGWSHFISFTDPAENAFTYPNWQLEKSTDQFQSVKLECHKPHGNSFVIKLSHCKNPEEATLLRGKSIAVERADLPALTNNTYYWSDLVGLNVLNTKGESLGIIDHLFETGSNDVIVINSTEKQLNADVPLIKQNYIPYLSDVVKEIDLVKKIMVVEWELI